MSKQEALDHEARERLLAFEREQKRRRAVNYATIGLTCFAAVVLVILFSGNKFAPVLQAVGLASAYEEGGIYADCSKRENRNSPFCQGKESQKEREWRGLKRTGGRHIPFSLSGK